MRLSRMALDWIVGSMGVSSAVEQFKRMNQAMNPLLVTPNATVGSKPNKVSQKKKHIYARRLGKYL